MSVAAISSATAAAPMQFNAASVRNSSPAEQRKAVAAQFEAILVRQMLGKTMNSVLGGSTGGVAGSVYGDMLTDTIAQQLTAGNGLGLSRFIQQQLTPRGENNASTPDAASVPATDTRSQPSAPSHS